MCVCVCVNAEVSHVDGDGNEHVRGAVPCTGVQQSEAYLCAIPLLMCCCLLFVFVLFLPEALCGSTATPRRDPCGAL